MLEYINIIININNFLKIMINNKLIQINNMIVLPYLKITYGHSYVLI